MSEREIIAIDPGSTESAYIRWNGHAHRGFGIVPNEHLRTLIRTRLCPQNIKIPLVIEDVVSYGKRVGASTFETAFWSGVFAEAWTAMWGAPYVKVTRREVKLYLCETVSAGDTQVRAALIRRFGDPGTRKQPNPVTFGLKSHVMQAFALAVYYWDHNYGTLQ